MTSKVYELARSKGPCRTIARAAGHPAIQAVPRMPTMAMAAAIGRRARISMNNTTKPRAEVRSSFIGNTIGERLVMAASAAAAHVDRRLLPG